MSFSFILLQQNETIQDTEIDKQLSIKHIVLLQCCIKAANIENFSQKSVISQNGKYCEEYLDK